MPVSVLSTGSLEGAETPLVAAKRTEVVGGFGATGEKADTLPEREAMKRAAAKSFMVLVVVVVLLVVEEFI